MDAIEILMEAEKEAALWEKYNDIFLMRIENIEFCLEQKRYIAALSLALTLPDICGKAEYPEDGNTSRYIKWFNKYMMPYRKPTSEYDADMPYLSGELVYNLRNGLLHAGNPNIDKVKVKEETCKIDRFELVIGKSLTGDTSMVAYSEYKGERSVVNREYRVNVYLLCTRLSRIAMAYYLKNKNKFNFFNYYITI